MASFVNAITAAAFAGLATAKYIPYGNNTQYRNFSSVFHDAPTGPALSHLGTCSLNLPSYLGEEHTGRPHGHGSNGNSAGNRGNGGHGYNGGSEGHPWGGKNSQNTNYYDYSQIPNTGVTRYYDWTITKDNIAPDGVEIPGFRINGEYPGPLLEANWGDYVEINVHNNISAPEGAAIHWHGILQHGTPSMDGVPGVEQCPIPPGYNFTYRWQANMYGSSWWHSHYSSQYGSGLVGPMIVHGPNNVNYDLDVGPIMVEDWYHQYYQQAVEELLQPIPNSRQPSANNVLINGKNNYDCADTSLPCVPNAGQASFNFTSGKVHRLRLINPSTAATMKISIDEHEMTVFANDFVEIQPYNTSVVTLGVGQRSDVLVYGSGNSDSTYYLRAFMPPNCAVTDNNQYNYAEAVIYYENADRLDTPTSSPVAGYNNQYCGNDDLSLTEPMLVEAVEDPSVTETWVFNIGSNGTHLLWYQNGRTMRIDYNDPILEQAKTGNLTFPDIYNVFNYGSNKTIRFILENHSGMVHPMHMHGHNLQILAEGHCPVPANLSALIAQGVMDAASIAIPTATDTTSPTALPTSVTQPDNTCWDGKITRASNPQRRDVQQMVPGGYLVVQWTQDNPGVWPFHCHIAWHISQGFAFYVLERPDDIVSSTDIPQSQYDNCRNWDAFTKRDVVSDIDSGI